MISLYPDSMCSLAWKWELEGLGKSWFDFDSILLFVELRVWHGLVWSGAHCVSDLSNTPVHYEKLLCFFFYWQVGVRRHG